MKQPRTRDQWQEAVDLAEVYLVIDSARKYGLVRGGPAVDVDRCEQLLAGGRARGITPAADCIERIIPQLVRQVTR